MKQNIFTKAFYASMLIALGASSVYAQGVISTFAGTGVAGFSGDGSTAITAQFSAPAGVSADLTGNLYVADKNNHRIRKIALDGTITTIAGTGSMSYSGMGGPAISASMEYPDAIFTDNAGNLLITDFFADCSYQISALTASIVNTCGHGSQGSDGDGGEADLARMQLPHGITKDAMGNTFIADYGNNRIRRVDALTNIVTTIAGGPVFGFSPNGTLASASKFAGINGVCNDAAGNLYVSDLGNHVVRKIDASGRVRTIAGNGTAGYSGDGGSAVSASLRSPGGLFVNASGYLFICDEASNVIRVVNLNTGIIKTFAGTGTAGFGGDGGLATTAQLNMPSAIWQVGSIFYIADMGNNRIRKVIDAGYKGIGSNGVAAAAANGFSIFPNPSNGSFTLTAGSSFDNGTFEVYNVIGVKVYTQEITKSETTINLNVPAGVYNVVLKTAVGSTSQKIVIQK